MANPSHTDTKATIRKRGMMISVALFGMMLLFGNLFPPLQLAGCAVTPSRMKGVVLDQDGSPVAGAEINIRRHLTIFSEEGNETSTETDSEGHFSYFGIQGFILSVSAHKDGYYRLHEAIPERGLSDSSRSYGPSNNGFPSPLTRQVFHLFRPPPPEPLIQHRSRDYRITRDGSPLIIRLNPTDAGPQREIELRCWTSVSEEQERKGRYDWRAVIRPLKGGLVRREGVFEFTAPAEGYEREMQILMPAMISDTRNGKWSSDVVQDVFLRFDGDLFARAKIRFIAGGDHFVVFESLLNPQAGSRNLSARP